MSLRHLILLRRFATSSSVRQSLLSESYKSETLWAERFNCKLLGGDEQLLKSINSKIITGQELDNLEVDIFINISSPRINEIAQLQESVKILERFRKTLSAHILLPSTPHAVCRLFLYSQRLTTLLNVLEDRVKYGVFPDFFSLNLLLDHALDKENYIQASRLASLVMLQEDFGINPITDALSLLAVTKYVESKTDFSDWKTEDPSTDPVLNGESDTLSNADFANEASGEKVEEVKKVEEEVEGEEEEEEIEYIRVPFLRNPYFDNHFDLTNPRVICGKTLHMLGNSFRVKDEELAIKCKLLGCILQGKWSESADILSKCKKSKFDFGPLKDLSNFYITNLHGADEPSDVEKASILSGLDGASQDGQKLSELVQSHYQNFGQVESRDIQELRASLSEWSQLRVATKNAREERETRKRIIQEIETKKAELERREQYLYFYDNLKKSRLTRINYD